MAERGVGCFVKKQTMRMNVSLVSKGRRLSWNDATVSDVLIVKMHHEPGKRHIRLRDSFHPGLRGQRELTFDVVSANE